MDVSNLHCIPTSAHIYHRPPLQISRAQQPLTHPFMLVFHPISTNFLPRLFIHFFIPKDKIAFGRPTPRSSTCQLVARSRRLVLNPAKLDTCNSVSLYYRSSNAMVGV
ncbi:hypothetical protein XPA_009297 [Xanthoria parietina]